MRFLNLYDVSLDHNRRLRIGMFPRSKNSLPFSGRIWNASCPANVLWPPQMRGPAVWEQFDVSRRICKLSCTSLLLIQEAISSYRRNPLGAYSLEFRRFSMNGYWRPRSALDLNAVKLSCNVP